jgi:hypothetical protein
MVSGRFSPMSIYPAITSLGCVWWISEDYRGKLTEPFEDCLQQPPTVGIYLVRW